jgi:hypothetical protein
VAEGGGLLNRYRVVKPYRGFESLRLRHTCLKSLCFLANSGKNPGLTPAWLDVSGTPNRVVTGRAGLPALRPAARLPLRAAGALALKMAAYIGQRQDSHSGSLGPPAD